MGQYTSYWLYQKYETRGSQEPIPCYPNVYSVDADGTMQKIVKIENDVACGYHPEPQVQYRWVNLPESQYVCDECPSSITRWQKTDNTICLEEDVPPVTAYKIRTFFVYGALKREIDCNESSELTRYEALGMSGTSYQDSETRTAIIGNCVTRIGSAAFQYCIILTGITIPNSVTSIGSNAFYNCRSLTNITIPNSVTSIGNNAFDTCTSLTSINIPNSVTSIGEYTFDSCTNLKRVNSDTDGECNIPGSLSIIPFAAFSSCTGLTSLNIQNGVTNINGFDFCSSLTSVTIPNSVTTISGSAFWHCSGLKRVNSDTDGECNIPNSVTSIGCQAFCDCSGLTSIVIPDSVTEIGGMAFSSCTSLTSVTVNADVPPVINICGKNPFSNTNDCPIYVPCNSLSAYKAASGWSTYASRFVGIEPCDSFKLRWSDNVYIIECNDNPELTEAEVTVHQGRNAIIGDCVTSIGERAFGFKSIESVYIPNSVTSIGSNAFYNCTSLTSITIPNSVTNIGGAAFSSCKSLTSVTIPNSVTSIGASAFQNCSGFTSITINSTTPPTLGWSLGANDVFYNTNNCPIYVPCGYVSAYKTAQYWRNYASRIQAIPPCEVKNKLVATYSDGRTIEVECNSSTELTTGETKPSGYQASAMTSAVIGDCVTSIGNNAFDNCRNLTSCTIGSGATSIGNAAFSGCTKLPSIIIPDSVTEIGGKAFSYCTNLISVTIPNSVTSIGNEAFSYCTNLISINIGNGVTSIGDYVFEGCSGLTSVTLSNGLTSIGYRAFMYCSGLTSIIIPDSVTSIGAGAFSSCKSLTSITIPNSVTNIGGAAFSSCKSLISINIGNGVTSIGDYVFFNCSGLTSVTVNATTPPTLGTNAFNNTNIRTIYVPAESVDAYKAATNWSNYASRIKPIP